MGRSLYPHLLHPRAERRRLESQRRRRTILSIDLPCGTLQGCEDDLPFHPFEVHQGERIDTRWVRDPDRAPSMDHLPENGSNLNASILVDFERSGGSRP